MSFPRYPKYKDSGVEWLGEVPEHWDVLRLKPILYEVDRRIGDQDALLLGLSKTAGLLPRADIGQNASESDDYSKYKECRVGDLVMNKMQAWNGVFGLSTHTGIVSPDYAVFRFRDQLFATFLTHVFRTDMAAGEFFCRCRGMGTAFLRINTGDFLDTKIALPPAEEVPCITAFLDRETAKIDALIAEQQRLIELLQEKRQAVISHAVTKGLNPDAPMKDSGIEWLGKVPEHWKVAPLKQIVSVPITDGPHETPAFLDEGVPFVSAEAVSSGRIDFAKVRGCISEEDNARYSLKYAPQRHDIYMVKSGATTGVTAIVEERTDFNIWSPLAAIRCGEVAAPYFVLNFLRCRNFQEAVTLNWSYGTQQNIGMGVIENLPCVLPPLAEQHTIVAHLNRFDEAATPLVNDVEQAITLLQERRSALISAAVTGQIDVRGLAGAEAA